MMKVVGEEGTSIEDYIDYLKGEFLDSVYLQQNAFDPVDVATTKERQIYVFDRLLKILITKIDIPDKDDARTFFNQLRQKSLDWNGSAMDSDDFKRLESEMTELLLSKTADSEDDIGERFKGMFE